MRKEIENSEVESRFDLQLMLKELKLEDRQHLDEKIGQADIQAMVKAKKLKSSQHD